MCYIDPGSVSVVYALALLPLSISIIAAVWVFVDSRRLYRESSGRSRVGGIPSWAWGIFVLLLWIVGLPAYVICRSRFVSALPESAGANKGSPRRVEEAEQYVKRTRARGKNDPEIRELLLDAGWSAPDVDALLRDTPGTGGNREENEAPPREFGTEGSPSQEQQETTDR